jgi:SAM-dependent methyltransferase
VDIRHLQANWDRFGETDPFWAILTHPSKKGGKWQIAEFFETGRSEIAAVMRYLAALPIPPGRERVLDFGCGVGRLTQAFAAHFTDCHGVDIAPSMIRLANRYNRAGARARYHLNARPDLALFADDTFDVIYSNLVLQHMQPQYSAAYIREFMRILRPGGVALFQLPSEPHAGDGPIDDGDDAPALPASGFRAQIRPLSMPRHMLAGSRATITVRVRNIGDAAWPVARTPGGRQRIELGNHWLDQAGRMVRNDDGRTALPYTVEPQESVDLPLIISAPSVCETYHLELDMVQEQIAWFQSHGSATVRRRIAVTADHTPWQRLLGRLSPMATGRTEPVMEMYGICHAEVLALIAASGGRVVDAQRYDTAGKEWISYRYCVTK